MTTQKSKTKHVASTATIAYRGRKIQVSPRGRKIYNALLMGMKFSTVDFVLLTNSSDPRKEIQRLRNLGINILDEWISHTDCASRYKRYYLKQNNND